MSMYEKWYREEGHGQTQEEFMKGIYSLMNEEFN